MQRVLSTVVLLGLLLASAAAFAITEHLKLIKSPIYDPKVTKVFSPVCHCATDKAEISFKLRHPDSVTVTIVDSHGNVVDTLATDASVEKNTAVTFLWDGKIGAGVIAPNGTVYQPQVALSKDPRTIRMPNLIAVDTVAPTVLSASDGAGVLIAGVRHGLPIRYLLSGKAHASLSLGGRRVVLSRSSRPRDTVKWDGGARGRTLPPGRYVLEVAAVDAAGNETPPAERKRIVVRIRAIALDKTSIHVAPGAGFTVKVRTGASRYTWRLGGSHATVRIRAGEKKLLHLRAPARRGRYRLFVSEHGYATTALVIVGKK